MTRADKSGAADTSAAEFRPVELGSGLVTAQLGPAGTGPAGNASPTGKGEFCRHGSPLLIVMEGHGDGAQPQVYRLHLAPLQRARLHLAPLHLAPLHLAPLHLAPLHLAPLHLAEPCDEDSGTRVSRVTISPQNAGALLA